MIAGSVSIVAGTGFIMGMDIWATVEERLHEHSPELGLGLRDLVQELTPILTGALLSDITFEAYLDPGGEDLVWVYPEDTAQEAFWNRIYVQYQEGGLLGDPTYTNAPHEMFYETAQGAGRDYAEMWALTYAQEGLDLCQAGAGIPL